jgi:outer membrane receptor protein involved in Fe transport
MKKKLSCLVVCVVMLTSLLAPAAKAETSGEGSVEELMFLQLPTVVVASKSEESVLTAPGTIYVITDKEIERFGWKSLEDCLKSLPSSDICDFLTYAQYGQRGFTSNGSNTEILIDGREVPTLSSNMIWLNNTILTNNIKRIEVLMGPNSTLYGSKALAGVINIVTKEGYNTKENIDLAETALTYGDGNRSQYEATFRKNRKDFSIGGSVSYFQENGNWTPIQQFAISQDFIRGANYNLHNKDANDFNVMDEDTGINLFMRFKDFYAGVNTRKSINNSGLEYTSYYGFNDNIQNRFDNYNFAGWEHEFSSDLKTKIEYTHAMTNNRYSISDLYQNIGHSVTLFNGKNLPTTYPAATSYATLKDLTEGSYTEIDLDRINGQVNYSPNDKNQIVAGFELSSRKDLQGNSIAGQATTGPDEQYIQDQGFVNDTVFVQDTYNMNEFFKFVLGLNYTSQSTVWPSTNKYAIPNPPDRVTPKVAAIYMPNKKSTWEVVYGEGFRDPLPGEIQRNINDGLTGVLKPMSMSMLEGDYKRTFNIEKGVDAFNQLSLYRMLQTDTITTMTGLLPATGTNGLETINGASQGITGIEDQIKVNSEKANGYLGFSYIIPEKQTVVAGLDPIVNGVPLTKVKAGAAYKITSMVEAGLTADYEDSVQTGATNIGGATGVAIATIPSATIVGLNVKVGDFVADGAKASVSFLIDNLFNATYYDANWESTNPYQFMQLPRNFRVTLKMTF